MTWVRTLKTGVTVCVLASSACPSGERPPSDRTAVQRKAPASGRRSDRWRFLPTLARAVAADVHAVPILELARPRLGQARIVAAVFRPHSQPALRVEVFDFDQRTGRLELVGTPTTILRLSGEAPRAAELAELRRQLAAPGSEVYRAIGHDTSGPSELFDRLCAWAELVRDDRAHAGIRTEALAELVRGIDDPLVFERDEVYRVIDELAGRAWSIEHETAVAKRRRKLVVRRPGRTLELELARKSGGWALVSLAPRAAVPSAPEHEAGSARSDPGGAT
jgi:hypothetical protein